MSYTNLFSSSKRGKLREYSKQFILWCKLISLPSDPKLIYHAGWNGDILRWSGSRYVYMLPEESPKYTYTYKTRISFPHSHRHVFFRLFYCSKTDLWFRNKIVQSSLIIFDKFIDYYLIKIHFGVIIYHHLYIVHGALHTHFVYHCTEWENEILPIFCAISSCHITLNTEKKDEKCIPNIIEKNC